MHEPFTRPPRPARPLLPAILSGARGRCPSCREGRLFRAYLKVADHCPGCAEALHHQRADDAPPYLTILVVGHVIVPLALALERTVQPPLWLHMAVWLPLASLAALALLPVAKGALVALQWALGMHGFGGEPDLLHGRQAGEEGNLP